MKRLSRHQHDFIAFLDQISIPFDNNRAERSIRSSITLCKNSCGNRSQRGANCQAVLMSDFRTLKQRGPDPIQTVVNAIEHYVASKQLPRLPSPNTESDD